MNSEDVKISDKLKNLSRKNIIIGLSGICGFLNIIIGLPQLFGFGLLAWGSSLSIRIFIGITLIPSGILAVIGALVEFKNLIIGSILCLLAGILTIVLPIIVNYAYLLVLVMVLYIYIPTIFIIVGGILGILEYKKIEQEKKKNQVRK